MRLRVLESRERRQQWAKSISSGITKQPSQAMRSIAMHCTCTVKNRPTRFGVADGYTVATIKRDPSCEFHREASSFIY
ncbi:hypothetical protein EMIT048CA2_220035 [Pseudomonas chlororaphis]